MRRLISVLLTVLLLFSSIHTTGFAKNDVPFEVTADGAYLEAIRVGTANIPELDTELQGLLEYMPEVYLVTIPFGCDEVKIKATDDALIIGETSDSQVLTDAEPDENGYYSIEISITEERIGSESQWRNEGFEFFMDPEIPLFSIESGRIPTENVEGFFYYFLKEYTNSEIEFCEVLPDVTIVFQRSTISSAEINNAPFEALAAEKALDISFVGTANIPELDTELQGLLEYMPEVYLVTIPFGCDEVKIKATDDALIMGETSDSQVLTDAEPDENGYYSIGITIIEEQISSGSQWKDEGFEFFMDPEIPLFSIESGRIPTENVEGFFYYFLKEYTNSEIEFCEVLPDVTIVFQRSTLPNGTYEEANKRELENLIAAVLSNYYREDDRYNGNPNDTIANRSSGFWAELSANNGELTKAQEVYNNPETTQSEVDNAVQKLSNASAKLIPITQLNATKLYETIQDFGGRDLTDFTAASASAYRTALKNAEEYLANLFIDGTATGENIAANQWKADGYADALRAAAIDLLSVENYNAMERMEKTVRALEVLFPYESNTESFSSSSFEAFQDAKIAVHSYLAEHPVGSGSVNGDYTELSKRMRAYWLAAYGLHSVEAPTVTLYFSDDFGMRYPEYAVGSSYEETLSMTSGASTLKELLHQTGLSTLDHLGYSHSYGSSGLLWDEWLIYINGVLVRDPNWTSEEVGQTIMLHDKGDLGANFVDWNEICVRNGDIVTLARVEAALKPTYVGGEGASMEEKAKFFGQLSLVLDRTAIKEGETLSGTVTRKAAHLPDYDGRLTAYPYATLAAYGPQLENGSYPAVPIIGEDDGSLTLNQAGIYLVMAFEPKAQDMSGRSYPNLNTASLPVVVTVNPLDSDELAVERENAIWALDNALNECSVEELGEAVYNQIFDIVNTAKGTIGSAASLAEIQNCLSAALDEISALKETVNGENLTAYRRMSSLLMLLPGECEIDAGLFTQGDAVRMNEALAQYETMTEYQRNMLTAAQMAQWNALKDAWGSDGSSLGEAGQITFTVSVVGGFGAQLDNRLNRVTTAKYSFEQSNDTYYVTNTRNNISTLAEPVTFTFDAPLEAWVLQLIYTESSDFEMYKVAWEGVEEDGIEYINDKVDNEYHIYVRYTDALMHEITKPAVRGDVKITIYTRSTGDLESLREAAVEELTAALNGYSKSDYEAAKWAELNNAYNDGVAAISAATSESKITEAKTATLAAMAAVEKKSSGDLGTVSVIVENTTYGEADFSGAFVTKTVSLTTDSSMMKCVLSALAEAGYTWTGTGGTGYDITYLSSIYIDANGNGTPDNDEKSLAEFDGGPQSGWMGTLNDWFVNEGLNMFTIANGKLKDGDVIRAQYTVTGYGRDLGATWANNDTSLKDLTVDGGSLGTEFDSSVLEYVLTPTGGSISLLPTAANKNFQVRIFLNQQNKTANADYYRSSESIPVKSGDVIWIGVGENAWGTMNEGTIVATWYKLNVVSSDDGSAVVKLISAIGSVTYSNYKEKQAAVALAKAAYEALSDTEKQNVTNYATLTAAEKAVKGFETVDELKSEIAKLPRTIEDTNEIRAAVNSANTKYSKLTTAQKNLLAVAETNKLLKAVNTLTLIDELKAIGATKDFVSTEANTEADVMAALRTWLTGQTSAKDEDVIISITGFTDANSSRDGSYTATVSFTLGSGSQAATQKKTISGTIKRSSDAGVSKIVINGKTTASGSDTSWTATLPYGSDPTKATFAITAAGKATPSAPVMAKTDGSEWTFTVTAEDGTKKDYTVKLSVSEVELTVLDSNVYDVSDDTVVTALSPVAVSGLDAIVADDLDLPEGTKEASVWLMLKIKAKSSDELTLAVTAWYAADGKEADKIPDDVLKNVELTLTVPLAGTEYAKVLYDSAYLDAKGSSSGITFDMAAAGDYTLIPDAHIAIVTFHEFDGVSDRQIVFYRGDAGNDLPAASKSGAAFKGWYAKADCTGDKFTTVSATLPTDLYPLWSYGVKTEEVGDIEDRVEVSAIVQGDVATITVESKKPCAVIVEKPDGSFERLEVVNKNADGSYDFVQKDYDADMVFYVAALGDYDENGVLEPVDLTAANLTIIGDVDLEPLSAFIMGAKDGKLRTVDLAKLFLHLARNDVEW